MNIIPFEHFHKKSTLWKRNMLTPYFKGSEAVLDFGCGDLSFAKSLLEVHPLLQITGVDVVDFFEKPRGIKFITYDGKKLPFKDNSFDTVISFYVFHHCEDAFAAFEECARVAKKRVIFVESVYRYPLELVFMRIMDWLYNIVKPESIPLSYQFFSFHDWLKVFEKNKMKMKSSKKIKQVFLPAFLPIGISYTFEVKKI